METGLENLGNKKENIRKKDEIIKELISFSAKYNNPISFVSFGLDEDSELIKNTKINSEVLKGLSKESIKVIESILESLKSFLKRPLFTTDIPEKAENRENEKWWKEHKKEVSKEAQDYYENNRIRLGKYLGIYGSLSYLSHLIVNPKVKIKLLDLNFGIPTELFNDNEKGDKVYPTLDDKEKIKVAEKFAEIVEEAISILEGK